MKSDFQAPKVSVVVPCYNGAKYLRETIQSVLAQDLPVLEIIVVDDGSTDDSADIAESFGAPVRVIRQSNQGESVARNRGIDEARGDWVAFLDADDLWTPDKMAEQAKLMSPGVGLVCSRYQVIKQGVPGISGESGKLHSSMFKRTSLIEGWPPTHISSVVVRKSIPVRFPVWTGWSEDVVYFLDLAGTTSFAISDRPLVIYRFHSSNQSFAPDISKRRDESIKQWLELNRSRISGREYGQLARAMKRRAEWARLGRALSLRVEGKPFQAAWLSAKVLAKTLLVCPSPSIERVALRSLLGASAEACRIPGTRRRSPNGLSA